MKKETIGNWCKSEIFKLCRSNLLEFREIATEGYDEKKYKKFKEKIEHIECKKLIELLEKHYFSNKYNYDMAQKLWMNDLLNIISNIDNWINNLTENLKDDSFIEECKKFACKNFFKFNKSNSSFLLLFFEEKIPKILEYIFNITTSSDEAVKSIQSATTLTEILIKNNISLQYNNKKNLKDSLEKLKNDFLSNISIVTRYLLNRVCVKLTDNLFAVYKVTLKGVTFEKFSDKCECEKNYDPVCDLDEKLKDLNICICKHKFNPISSGNTTDINVCFIEELEYIINLLITGNEVDKDKKKFICKGDYDPELFNEIDNIKNITEEKAPVLLKKCNSKIFINSSVILRIAEEINEEFNKKETK